MDGCWEEEQLFDFDNVIAGVFRSTVGGRFLLANNTLLNLLGALSLNHLNQTGAQGLYRNQADRVSILEEIRLKGTAIRYGIAFKRLDGSSLWVDLHIKGRRDNNGGLSGLQGIIIDASERVRVEQRLKESEFRYRQLAELSQDGIFIFDGTRFIYSNSNLNRFTGRDKVEGLTLDDLFDPRQKESITRFYSRGKQFGLIPERYEIKVVWPDGSVHYGEVAGATYRIGDNYYVQGSVRDITQRRSMERELYIQAALLDNAGETAIVSDRWGMVRYINRTGAIFTGYEPDEIVGKPLSMLVVKEDIPLLAYVRDQVAAWGRHEAEIRFRSRRGQVYTCEITSVRIAGLEGDAEMYMSLIRDVSPLKQALKDLASANRYMEELNRRLSQNQEEAHQLLEAQFPLEPLVTARFSVEQSHRLSSTVGGDIVGYDQIKPGYISFFLIDASGHGLSSAMEASNARKLLLSPELAPYRFSPEEMLLNFDCLFKENRFFPEDYVAILYGFIDETGGMVSYATMGIHNQPILLKKGLPPQFMPSGGLPSFGHLPPRVVSHRLELEPGNRLVIYSDGFLEARGENGELFGYERLARRIDELSVAPIKEITEGLLTSLSEFTHLPIPADDCSLLIISAREYAKGELLIAWEESISANKLQTVPARVEDLVARVASQFLPVERERHQILLLELVTNALIHGCLDLHLGKEEPGFAEELARALASPEAGQRQAVIRVEVREAAVDYVVTDSGSGYDGSDILGWKLEARADLYGGHLGLKMVKLLADELEITPPGNRVRISIYHQPASAAGTTPETSSLKRIFV